MAPETDRVVVSKRFQGPQLLLLESGPVGVHLEAEALDRQVAALRVEQPHVPVLTHRLGVVAVGIPIGGVGHDLIGSGDLQEIKENKYCAYNDMINTSHSKDNSQSLRNDMRTRG